MILTHKGKEYEVKFTIKFFEELQYAEMSGDRPIGFNTKVGALLGDGDILALRDILYFATKNVNKPAPTKAIIEDILDEHEDIDGLVDEVIAGLEKANVSKRAMRALKEFIAKLTDNK